MKNKVLEKIIQRTKKDLENRKEIASSASRRTRTDSFQQARTISSSIFKNAILNSKKEVALITEIKLVSPSEGILGSKKDVLQRVREYEKAGADAISYVCEKHFFKGDIAHVKRIKNITKLPVLVKDFVIDEYQILEAKNGGADAILLIARIVDEETLNHFVEYALALGIEPIVEIDNENDLQKAIQSGTNILAVNARDIDTLEVDVKKACRILKKIPNKFIKLSFSGIRSNQEFLEYRKAGTRGVLVGTSLMKSENASQFINSLSL